MKASYIEADVGNDPAAARRNELLDEDDKKRPDEGFFHSPGYEY